MISKTIKITSASLNYGNLNLRPCGKNFFPKNTFGPHSRSLGLGDQITLKIYGRDDPIFTDIPTDKKTGNPRWFFRKRKWVKEFVNDHNLSPGNKVIIYRLNRSLYYITPSFCEPGIDLFEETLPPTVYAQKISEFYIQLSDADYRKRKGQFFTPPNVAHFMGRLGIDFQKKHIRILDPGTGAGILSCAVCEEVLRNHDVTSIEVDAYEEDKDILPFLCQSFEHASNWMSRRGVKCKFNIIDKDFILSTDELAKEKNRPLYDLIISNPPYFKISAKDARANLLKEVVYGQPNIYSLFMAASVRLLEHNGAMVFIVPRSFTSGNYFKFFRKVFFSNVNPLRIHLFDSRKEVFSNQSVLQENLIIKARKNGKNKNLTISTSPNGEDLEASKKNVIPLSKVLVKKGDDVILRLPLDTFDDVVVDIVDSWKATLSDYGMKISTGPVVPFRATEFIATQKVFATKQYAPLLWMINVRPMSTVWPSEGSNREASNQYIVDNEFTRNRKLLVPNNNLVLLRRFSAKEQFRRLTASPLFEKQFRFEMIGIENHLNYIYRPSGDMSCYETLGLAALLNSSLLDKYFRICNGNTQVGATEIRSIPLPDLEEVKNIGIQLDKLSEVPTLQQVDMYIWRMAEKYSKRSRLKEVVNCVG